MSKPMEFFSLHWGDYYDGTLQQLLDTGKFKPEWFPGAPGNKPTVNTLERLEFDGRIIPELHISRKDKTRRRFTARVFIDEQERQMRNYLAGYENARSKSMERVSHWLRAMVKSEAEFIAAGIHAVKNLMSLNTDRIENNAGYSLTPESRDKFHAAMNALAETIRGAQVDYSPELHEETRHQRAVDAFEHQGLGQHIDDYPSLNIDREAEKAKFVADALAIPVDGWISVAVSNYMDLADLEA